MGIPKKIAAEQLDRLQEKLEAEADRRIAEVRAEAAAKVEAASSEAAQMGQAKRRSEEELECLQAELERKAEFEKRIREKRRNL